MNKATEFKSGKFSFLSEHDVLFVELAESADRIEQQVNIALTRINNLTQSTLAKAFRGELTEQWRKDNPKRAAVKPARKARKPKGA